MASNQPTQLTTAAEIIETFNIVASDTETSTKGEAVELLKDLTQLFIRKSDAEIAGCVASNADAVQNALLRMYNLYPGGSEEEKTVVAKGVSLVDDLVKAGNLNAANDWLVRGYKAYPGGSEERRAVVAKRLSLVDDFVKVGNLDAADAWLVTGYKAYPSGSEEEKALVAKGVSLVDDFVKVGNLDAADAWLVTGYRAYPCGSEERRAVVAKGVSLVDDLVKAGNRNAANDWLGRRDQLRQLRSSGQMGAAPKVDVAGLRVAAKRELAKLQAASVGH